MRLALRRRMLRQGQISTFGDVDGIVEMSRTRFWCFEWKDDRPRKLQRGQRAHVARIWHEERS
jgi:hypothetical protein